MINLQKNYRSNPAILLFINGFISKVFKNKTDLLYEIPDTKIKNRFERPGIRWFTRQKNEAEYVIKKVKKYENKSIAIVSRWNRNLRLIKKMLNQEQLDNIDVTTVHKYKGKEANIVFFVGFNIDQDEKDEDEFNIIYTAISRAKSKLFITSAYPKFSLDTLFSSGTYTLIDSQRCVENPYKKLKAIKKSKNFSIQKLNNGLIDSLIFKVHEGDAPFCREVKRGRIDNNQRFFNREPGTEQGMKYIVKYHHRWKNYYFEFTDLNVLKKNNYSDTDKLLFCENIVKKYFDSRIEPEKILIHRLDLYKCIKFKNKQQLDEFRDYVSFHLNEAKCKSIFSSGYKDDWTDYKQPHEIFTGWDSKTIYFNCHKSKYYNLTGKVYDPCGKEKNTVNIKNMEKIEFTAKGKFLMRNDVMGKKPNIEKLKLMIRNDQMKDMFWRWLVEYCNPVATWFDENPGVF